MRLDHLLSKELLATGCCACMGVVVVVSVAHCAGVCSAVGAHGWNINESFFGMVFCAVSWCEYGNVRLPLWGVWCCWESVPGCGVWGLCLAHCWGSEATGPCAAMHGTVVSVFPASGSVLARVCGGGLVDGVVV